MEIQLNDTVQYLIQGNVPTVLTNYDLIGGLRMDLMTMVVAFGVCLIIIAMYLHAMRNKIKQLEEQIKWQNE